MHSAKVAVAHLLGPKLMFAERDEHYPSRPGQTSVATAVTNITKPVTKNNFRPSTPLARNGNWPLRPPKFEAVYLAQDVNVVIYYQRRFRTEVQREGEGGGREEEQQVNVRGIRSWSSSSANYAHNDLRR